MIDFAIEIVAFSVVIFSLVISLVSAIRYKMQITALRSEIIQQNVDINHVKSRLAQALLEVESKKLENTDGFLAFLSESRDWAFNYIEEVGKSFEDLDSTMQTIFQWSDTYGDVNGETEHSEAIREIKTAYEKFKNTMPNNKQGETNAKSN
jgi:hypothetical protein